MTITLVEILPDINMLWINDRPSYKLYSDSEIVNRAYRLICKYGLPAYTDTYEAVWII